MKITCYFNDQGKTIQQIMEQFIINYLLNEK
jgi:hypothetical protein